MDEPVRASSARSCASTCGGTVGKIMLAIGMFEGWKRYMPELIHRAAATNSAVHILEFAAPLGMGLFTSNTPPEGDAYPEPSTPASPIDEQDFNPEHMPADTAEAAAETTTFLETVAEFLRSYDLEVTTAWLPAFDHAQMGEYARAHAVDTVALIRRGWWATLMGGDARPLLKRQGLAVVDLKPSDPIEPPGAKHPEFAGVAGTPELSTARTPSETNQTEC